MTPEPSAGRVEHISPDKLGNYYTEMGFQKVKDSRYWCSTIGDIMTRIDAFVGITKPKEGTLIGLLNKNTLGTIKEEDNDNYGGGRRKRTKNKRTKRKSKKSKKTRKRRN